MFASFLTFVARKRPHCVDRLSGSRANGTATVAGPAMNPPTRRARRDSEGLEDRTAEWGGKAHSGNGANDDRWLGRAAVSADAVRA